MSDFVQVMKDWRRLCETIQSENQQTSSGGWCKGCPVQGVCVIDTEIKDTTDKGLAMIGERIQSWAAENPEPVYPSWGEWLHNLHVVGVHATCAPEQNIYYPIVGMFNTPIPADIAEKLGLKPKEGTC